MTSIPNPNHITTFEIVLHRTEEDGLAASCEVLEFMTMAARRTKGDRRVSGRVSVKARWLQYRVEAAALNYAMANGLVAGQTVTLSLQVASVEVAGGPGLVGSSEVGGAR